MADTGTIWLLYLKLLPIDVKPTRQLRREMKPCNVEERRKWNDISNCPANSTLGEEHIRQQSFYLQLPDSPLLSFIVWDYFLFLSVQLDLGILNVDTLGKYCTCVWTGGFALQYDCIYRPCTHL